MKLNVKTMQKFGDINVFSIALGLLNCNLVLITYDTLACHVESIIIVVVNRIAFSIIRHKIHYSNTHIYLSIKIINRFMKNNSLSFLMKYNDKFQILFTAGNAKEFENLYVHKNKCKLKQTIGK